MGGGCNPLTPGVTPLKFSKGVWGALTQRVRAVPGRQKVLATLWPQHTVKQFVGLIYLDHWHSKTTTADKCVNK